MEYLYVCHFSNEHIKVGRSLDPKARIAAHADRVACMGIELVDHFIVECVGCSRQAEADLINRCAEIATKRNKSEWFEGLDFAVITNMASFVASLNYAPSIEHKPSQQALTEDQCRQINETRKWLAGLRYQFVSKDGVGTWIDRNPDIPHWPDSGVSRWDLRPSDWHKHWPELISHPCALLFAPTHPHREGPPKFGDWILSWSVGFTPTDDINVIVTAWDKTGRKRWDLRPKDWHRIWPELIGTEGAPEVPEQIAEGT